jgi:hypothetical protein
VKPRVQTPVPPKTTKNPTAQETKNQKKMCIKFNKHSKMEDIK